MNATEGLPTEPGWYLCDEQRRDVIDERVMWWNGEYLQPSRHEFYKNIDFVQQRFTNFRRLIEAPAGDYANELLAAVTAITTNWTATNQRRAELIAKKVARQITDEERNELNRLQEWTGARSSLIAPLPFEQLEKVKEGIPSPASEEKIVVGGRECNIVGTSSGWYIGDLACINEQGLNEHGEWSQVNWKTFGSESAAIEFARACATKGSLTKGEA